MAKREIELSLVVYYEDADGDSDYIETTGTLDLDIGEVALEDEDDIDGINNIKKVEFTLMGESYPLFTDTGTGKRKTSDESLEEIKEAFEFGCGYEFTVQGSYAPMDLLRFEKDTFYEVVESQFNERLESGSIEIMDMELSFDSIDDGEATIVAKFIEFMISID